MALPWHCQQLLSKIGRMSAEKEIGLSAAQMGANPGYAQANRKLAVRLNQIRDRNFPRVLTAILSRPETVYP